MTNEEKINLIAKKILVLSNNLEKYQSELNQLKQELMLLQTQTTKVGTPLIFNQEPVVSPVEETTTPVPEIKKTEPVIIDTTEQKIPEPIFEVAQPPKKAKTESSFNFEEFIGAKLITIIGIAVLVIGLGIGVKYAIDKDLITPLTRIVLAYIAGGILLFIALKLKPTYKAFSAVLLSGGMASLYFTTFAAYSMYSLFPQLLAFAIMLIFTAFTVFAATVYSLEIIGIIGLVGAYFVPVLLSDGTGKIEVMLVYMSIINAGILFLSFKRNWKILNHVAFGLSWIIFSAWFLDKYNYEKHFITANVFAFLFFIIFYISNMAYKLVKHEKFSAIDIIRLVSNSFIYFGIGYAALNNSVYDKYLGLFTVGNALVHFVFAYMVFKNKMLDRNLFYFLIALVLSFITIAIPVQLEGNWVTLFWSAEALLLFYIGRKKSVLFYEWIALGMIVLALFSSLQDTAEYHSMVRFLESVETIKMKAFLNMNFFTELFVVLSLSGIVYLHQKNQTTSEKKLPQIISYGLVSVLLITVYSALSAEISWFFDIKYYSSAVSIPGSESWAQEGYITSEYDWSWSRLQSVSLLIYNTSFLIILTFLCIKKWNNPVLRWVSLGLNFFFAIVFISVGLGLLSYLRNYYLNPENAKYFYLNPAVVYLRYLCFGLFALLLWFTNTLLKNIELKEFNIRKYYTGALIHIFILVLLCNEMVNIYHLTNEHGEHFFKNLDAVYKLGYTLLFAVYSFGLIAFGIFKKNRIMRVLAIIVFGITLVKLVTFDTWNLSTGYKVIAYMILGAILLIVAFLYQKFKSVIFGEDKI